MTNYIKLFDVVLRFETMMETQIPEIDKLKSLCGNWPIVNHS